MRRPERLVPRVVVGRVKWPMPVEAKGAARLPVGMRRALKVAVRLSAPLARGKVPLMRPVLLLIEKRKGKKKPTVLALMMKTSLLIGLEPKAAMPPSRRERVALLSSEESTSSGRDAPAAGR